MPDKDTMNEDEKAEASSEEEVVEEPIVVGPQLSLADILEVDDSELRQVDVPEWKGSVYMKNMSGHERDKFETMCIKQTDGKKKVDVKNLKAMLLSLVICDATGKLLMARNDVDRLNGKNAAVINRLNKIAQEINGIGLDENEELEKNLNEEQNDDSGSN